MRGNKYHSRKVEYNGITFDSKRELRRYKELLEMQGRGDISDLQRQVRYVVIPAQREPDTVGKRGGVHRGKLIEREATYVADFVYTKDGNTVVEDTKGFRTKDYVLKRKLMLYRHGIRIQEI